ncbi:hypothetical protein NC651_022864 [Populus alba x Populus x berolinensis]|nr:hypothetical protein NC651_022864 [Populus alba x Populus x berolinensis]
MKPGSNMKLEPQIASSQFPQRKLLGNLLEHLKTLKLLYWRMKQAEGGFVWPENQANE